MNASRQCAALVSSHCAREGAHEAMAAVIRSTAAFDERFVKCEVFGQVARAIKDEGWTTMGAFAVCWGLNPESVTDEMLNEGA